MANEIDELRPEVREAVEYCDDIFDDADNGEWNVIRAELLRLADYEAELATLKARITEAPIAMAYASATDIPAAHMNRLPARLIGKRVALVVVED